MGQAGMGDTFITLLAAFCLTNLFVTFCVTGALDSGDSDPLCHPLTPTFCWPEVLSYNTTILPNLAGHSSQADAAVEVGQYVRLVKLGCSPFLAAFLCSVFFPKCQDFVAVGPCRSSCEAVKAACGPLLEGSGYAWPDLLGCNQFPLEVVGGPSPTCLKLESWPSGSPATTVAAATLDGGGTVHTTAAAATTTTRASVHEKGSGPTRSGPSVALGNKTRSTNIEVMSPVQKEGGSTFPTSRSSSLAVSSVTAVFVAMVTSLLLELV